MLGLIEISWNFKWFYPYMQQFFLGYIPDAEMDSSLGTYNPYICALFVLAQFYGMSLHPGTTHVSLSFTISNFYSNFRISCVLVKS